VRPDEDPQGLWPEERALVARAVPSRRREFAAGRACARRLLAELGFAPAPLVAGPGRRPKWPPGAVGSIAHDRAVCAVAVARTDSRSSLGVDVEPDEPLEEDAWGTICTRRELDRLAREPAAGRGRAARFLFSAKECAYKCLDPFTPAPLDFRDVEIELDAGTGRFRVVVLESGGRWPAGTAFDGFRVACAGSFVTGMALAPDEP
jgi:4'-phosphopantetheinyl transferase EntD